MIRDDALRLLREVLAARATAQADHDTHLFAHLSNSDPGSPLEHKAQNLRGILNELDAAAGSLRAVIDTCDVLARNAPAVEAWMARSKETP